MGAAPPGAAQAREIAMFAPGAGRAPQARMRPRLLFAFAFLAVGLAAPAARAEDDPDILVRTSNWRHSSEMVDFVRDPDGVLVMAHVDGDTLEIRTSSDDGASWSTVYTEALGFELNSIALDIARGFAKAPYERMVHVALQYHYRCRGCEEDGVLYFSGPYDRPWLPGELGSTWYWGRIEDSWAVYYNRTTVEVRDVDVAVVPDGSDGYSVVTAYQHPTFAGQMEVWMHENDSFGFYDATRAIPLAGEQGAIIRDDTISFAAPSIAADAQNRRAVIAWGEMTPRSGGEVSFAEYYVPGGFPKEIWRGADLHNPVVAINQDSEIYFAASSGMGPLSLYFDSASRGGGPMSPSDLGPVTRQLLSRRPDLEVRGDQVRLTTIEPIDEGSPVGAVFLYAGVPVTTASLSREQISDPSAFQPFVPFETPKLSFYEGTAVAWRDIASGVLLDP
jgi:hypothetical protein